MKLKSLVLVGFATLLTVGCSAQEVSQKPETEAVNQAQTQKTAVEKVSTSNAENLSGTFKSAEHPTQGEVKVVTENGKKYLEFDGNFKTDSGPDLFVILHRNDTLPITGIKEKDYVSIAPLKNTSGTQSYEIPANINISEFKSVAVWCREFNATFGYAPFKV
ncbi:DM13 domain-containing protein [Mastigocoleus testarum]|uniref:Electron transfer flavoprotein n=1 Tax=Mastigocoleus testarum BC008 TaxID=371196 RepID=A0A0V7ZRX0_9CYAN|nr:DM13 domain-containing protein [Mastigocoleus testarum]KST67392.1 electron transfer flavoprotein [Mastigocoleus testarum BC008]